MEKLTKSRIRTWQSSRPMKQTRQDTDKYNYEKISHKTRDSLNQGEEQPSWGVAEWHSVERLRSPTETDKSFSFFLLYHREVPPRSPPYHFPKVTCLSVSQLLVIMTNKGDKKGASSCQILEYLWILELVKNEESQAPLQENLIQAVLRSCSYSQ